MKRNRPKLMAEETPIPETTETPARADARPTAPKPAKAPKLTLAGACAAVRLGLKVALAALIAAGIRESDLERLRTENTFEDVKNGEPTLELLAQAANRLQAVADLLANTSTARPDDLRDVRSAARVATKNLDALTPA